MNHLVQSRSWHWRHEPQPKCGGGSPRVTRDLQGSRRNGRTEITRHTRVTHTRTHAHTRSINGKDRGVDHTHTRFHESSDKERRGSKHTHTCHTHTTHTHVPSMVKIGGVDHTHTHGSTSQATRSVGEASTHINSKTGDESQSSDCSELAKVLVYSNLQGAKEPDLAEGKSIFVCVCVCDTCVCVPVAEGLCSMGE
jgi:hypothetical protein